MQKLLGISLTGLALAFLAVGSIGCQDGKKSSSSSATGGTSSGEKTSGDKSSKGGTTGEQAKDVTFKGPTGKAEIAKKNGKVDVKIELSGKAPDKVALTIKAIGSDKKEVKGIMGEGEIAKDAMDGNLKLSTGDTEVPAGTYTIEVHGTKIKNHASFELTVK